VIRMATRKTHPKDGEPHKRTNETPFLEWLLGGVGVMLVIACVAFLVYEGMTDREEPGPVTATVVEATSAGDSHVVTFNIRNGGSQTLSNLHVTARLFDGEREVESVTTEIDYLPGRSSQEGGFYFKSDPRGLRVEIQPGGYQKP
jgi:uncharacterized protein (TIGR02588 family)